MLLSGGAMPSSTSLEEGMRRREFIRLFGGVAAAAWALTAPGEQPALPVVNYSTNPSARASSDGENSRPRAFAALRLMIRSNLVGCSTGMSFGFAPRRILST